MTPPASTEKTKISAHGYLVVDDAATIRTTLQSYLEDQGATPEQIHLAAGGKEGLELFRDLHPDVVFMDIAMPGLDGEKATEAILEEDPAAKIVVITGRSRQDERSQHLLSIGAFDFLEKPIRRSDVERVLQEIHAENGHGGRIR